MKLTSKVSKSIREAIFEAAFQGATAAANAAGDEWVAKNTRPVWGVRDELSGRLVGTMLDVCGFAWLIAKKNTSFWKWGAKKYGWSYEVKVPHKYHMRQEMGLLEACEHAACEFLRNAGIEGLYVQSRID